MTGAKATIELPEQIEFDVKTAHGQIRQLRRAASFTDSPLVSFTIGKISGQLYTRAFGDRVLLVESRVSPPEKVGEVLWMRTGHLPQWLKPLPVRQRIGTS
jgi:hypothetical protein